MKHIFCGEPGETMFTTRNRLGGRAFVTSLRAAHRGDERPFSTRAFRIRPDAGIWWKIVQDHKVDVMFSAADRNPRAEETDTAFLRKHDLSSLKHLFPRGRAARRARRTPGSRRRSGGR